MLAILEEIFMIRLLKNCIFVCKICTLDLVYFMLTA